VTGIVVHADEIARCAKTIGTLSGTSTKLNDATTTASVPAVSWGALGHLLGLYQQYDELLGDLHGHFGKMTEGFGKIDSALTATAQTYTGHEQTTTAAFGNTLQSGLDSATAPPMVSGGEGTSNLGALGRSYGDQYSGDNVGKASAKLIPFGGSSYSLMKDSAKLGGDLQKGDGAAIAKDVVSVIIRHEQLHAGRHEARRRDLRPAELPDQQRTRLAARRRGAVEAGRGPGHRRPGGHQQGRGRVQRHRDADRGPGAHVRRAAAAGPAELEVRGG
jgi:hypothetical protein